MSVTREEHRISVVKDGRVLWTGRPSEHIVYPENGQTWAKRADRCTDAELIHAVEQLQGLERIGI